MASFAQAQFVGHLGRDPETRRTQNGTDITTVSMAVNTGYGNNQKTTWWNIIAFDKTGEAMVRFLKKGDPVMFVGEPSVREYDDKEGNKRFSAELTVSKMVLLKGKDVEETRKPAATKSTKLSDEAPFDDEIPF